MLTFFPGRKSVCCFFPAKQLFMTKWQVAICKEIAFHFCRQSEVRMMDFFFFVWTYWPVFHHFWIIACLCIHMLMSSGLFLLFYKESIALLCSVLFSKLVWSSLWLLSFLKYWAWLNYKRRSITFTDHKVAVRHYQVAYNNSSLMFSFLFILFI